MFFGKFNWINLIEIFTALVICVALIFDNLSRLGLSVNKTFQKEGLVRDLNPGPLAPKARIIPLDQRAIH